VTPRQFPLDAVAVSDERYVVAFVDITVEFAGDRRNVRDGGVAYSERELVKAAVLSAGLGALCVNSDGVGEFATGQK
jgi:hypothetical protein